MLLRCAGSPDVPDPARLTVTAGWGIGRGAVAGMFLATTVNLSATGLPGTAKIPPPWAALLPVTWLSLTVSGPPAAGPLLVIVASKIPPPGPEAVLRLIWLKVMVKMPPLTAPGATGARLTLAMPPPLPWSPALSAGRCCRSPCCR